MKSLLNISVAVLIMLLFHSAANAYKLPGTGKTKCYQAVSPYAEIDCADTGQDGEYNINPMSYTDHDNGTVTDNNTGLVWQKCSAWQDFITCSGAALAYNWYQATGTSDSTYNPSGGTDICGELKKANFGGYNDWRLPTEQELHTIVDYSIPYPGQTIKTEYFPNTGAANYWSTTTYANDPSSAWGVGFELGFVRPDHIKSYNTYVRCVRGGQPARSFNNNTNGTVTDNKTGLIWQKCSAGLTDDMTCSGSASNYAWSDALGYCNNLLLAEQTDWRLPNVKELKSLTDVSRYNPAINTDFFPTTIAGDYWSSTSIANYPYVALYVNFNYGIVFDDDLPLLSYVRCVRGGQNGSLGNFLRLMHGITLVNNYPTFYDAYGAAGNTDDTIQAQAVVSTEELTFASPKAFFLRGGYDSGFATNSDFTTVNSLTIKAGKVTIEKMIIK